MKKIVFIIIIIIICPFTLYSQVVECIENNNSYNLENIVFYPSDNIKKARSNKNNTGMIYVDYSECPTFPDSLKIAVDAATEIWNSYMSSGDYLNLKIMYEDLSNTEIKTSIYYKSNSENIYYPLCLYRKKYNETALNNTDAIISINKNIDWCIGIGKTNYNQNKLSIAILKSIAIALGFGSSVKRNARKDIVFGFNKGMSIFDTLIFNEDGLFMKNIKNSQHNELKKMVQPSYGYLYAHKKEDIYKLYAPSTFDENNSLKTFLCSNTLMSINNNNALDFAIDSITLNVLNALGWNFKENINNNFEICTNETDDSGILSAYQSHKFFIKPNDIVIKEPYWEYLLPLKDGTYKIVKTSNDVNFSISAIDDENLYKHTLEGDIRGFINFCGIVNGKEIKCTH